MTYEDYWDDCTLALRFDESPPVDDKGASVSLYSGATISSAWSDASTSSLLLNSSGNSAAVVDVDDFFYGVGTGAFTLCLSFKLGSLAGGDPQFLFRAATSGDSICDLYVAYGEVAFYGVGVHITTGFAPVVGTAYRVMVVREASGVIRLFINGDQLGYQHPDNYGSIRDLDTFYDPSSGLWIGGREYEGSSVLDGYVDEVFFVPGVALETSAHVSTPVFSTGGGGLSDVTCDVLGAIELGGELLAVQAHLADCLGALVFDGELSAEHHQVHTANCLGEIVLAGELLGSHPPYATISGPIKFAGDLQAGQPVFALIGGSLPLSGALLANAGPVAALGGPLVLGGSLLAGRGAAGACAGQISLSGGAQARHGRAGDIAGTLSLGGALSVLHRQAFAADCLGEITLSGLLSGDYLLHPPGEQHDAITVFRREQRIVVHV